MTLPRGWHVLIEPVALPGAEQMARDAGLRAVALALEAPVLRLYSWRPACVSFGAHEAAARRFSPTAIRAAGLDAVRRPTGGRAVLHRDDLTYAIATPPSLQTSLVDLLDDVHQCVALALAALGLAAHAAPKRRAPAPDAGGICFDAPLGGELLLDGRKVLGSAQHRGADGTLQHGSLLLADPQSRLSALRLGPHASAVPDAIATVATALGRPIAFGEMAPLLLQAWMEATGPIMPLDTEQVADAAAPHRASYADPAWTWRR